jgi:hydrogenase expression/formation protein HypC
MCLAIPGLVESINGRMAVIDFGGVKREAVIDLMEPGTVKEGSYVIVHTGFVIQILDEKEAQQTLEIWKEILSNVDSEGII